jgi:hypothetical protein
VPIYDGRETSTHSAFQFTDEDFRNLPSWPLYQEGSCEIPLDAVVAVGYTLSTYVGNSGLRCLSTNAQFVVLLALTGA